MKPIIGLTPSNYLAGSDTDTNINNDYLRSVLDAGGVPVVLPITHDLEVMKGYLRAVDGLLLTGGGDILPHNYGEEPVKELKSVSGDRDDFEFEMFRLAHEIRMPVLGICRGCQIINVALGGTLYQDINTQVDNVGGHYQKGLGHELYHSADIVSGTLLYDIFKEKTIYINSYHHQAVKELGSSLIVSAWAKDGIIEAFEADEDDFIMGIQWHPEEMASRHEIFKKIFDAFCGECINFGK